MPKSAREPWRVDQFLFQTLLLKKNRLIDFPEYNQNVEIKLDRSEAKERLIPPRVLPAKYNSSNFINPIILLVTYFIIELLRVTYKTFRSFLQYDQDMLRTLKSVCMLSCKHEHIGHFNKESAGSLLSGHKSRGCFICFPLGGALPLVLQLSLCLR